MTGVRGWGLPEQHLALDAIVAFVDGELTASARDRAAAHLAHCPTCSSEAATQRQARAAVRSADVPSISADLLSTLRSIPTHTELPAQPEGLALSDDGQLVTSGKLGTGPALGSSAPLGSGQPLGSGAPLTDDSARSAMRSSRENSSNQPAQPDQETSADRSAQPNQSGAPRRRTRHGAGVVFSGLMLGALALVNLPSDEQETDPQRASLPGEGDSLPASARSSPASDVPAPTSATQTSSTTPMQPPEPEPTRAAAGH